MSEETEVPTTEKSASTSDSSTGLMYQSITDGDCQKANVAFKEFDQGNFEKCLKNLKSLQLNRPQDAKVFHNICVADYYQSECHKVAELYSNLLCICKQANIDVQDIDSIDDVDQCVVFFNRAVILYHMSKFHGAIHILDKVFQFVEPLDEILGQKICLLLVELYLCTHQPKKALGIIGYVEAVLLSGSTNKSNKSPDKGTREGSCADELKLKLVQFKARCYTMMKTVKPCKREIKALMMSGSKMHHIAAVIIKSHLEYQRGNYRKSIKILNSTDWPEDYSKYFLETGDCLQAIYYNNLGCIHYYMGKPSLGAFYIKQGFKELDAEIRKVQNFCTPDASSSQPLHTLSFTMKKILIYNMGMQQFQREDYHEAFKYFLEVSDSFSENPRLWLRIAECCIQIHKQKFHEGSNDYEAIKSVIGTGQNRKIVLNPTNEPYSRQVVESSSGPAPTLSFAVCALRNALMLLPKDSLIKDAPSSTLSAEEKDLNPLEENCLQAPPCNAIPVAEIQNLRNAVLLALSYVSLRLGELILAHDYAIQLLSQPKLSESHKYLGHMYAGEALVYLDKISEAVEHFNPSLFSDSNEGISLPNDDAFMKHHSKASTPDKAEYFDKYSKLKSAWSPNILASAQLVTQYNLSVVYALRGEWSKALHLASEVIDDPRAPPQTKTLIVYIYLCQGATDVALSFLNQHISHHQK